MCIKFYYVLIKWFFLLGLGFGVKVKEGLMMLCILWVVVLVCFILISYCVKEKSKENE